MDKRKFTIVVILISGLSVSVLVRYLMREIGRFINSNSDILNTFVLLKLIPIVILFLVGTIFNSFTFLYYFPEIRPKKYNQEKPDISSPFDVIHFVSTEEGRLVLNAINHRGNKCFQFELSKDTGLIKIKIHRIVYRFVDRGILSVEKVGKSNLLRLVEWIGYGKILSDTRLR